MLLASVLRQLVRAGTLEVVDAAGRHYTAGSAPGPSVSIRLHDDNLRRRLLWNPRLAVGEAYMDGSLTIERGTLYDFLDLLAVNQEIGEPPLIMRLFDGFNYLVRRLLQTNDPTRARANVAHHYDLSERLYELFLDSDRQYSCAYFERDSDDLDRAQLRKKQRIARKLRLQPGQRVLDIGSGWGGLALTLASIADVEVLGVTLSTEQQAAATRRAEAAGLAHRVRFELRDYRDLAGPFDRIVSVGMFEHVGLPHYREFFQQIRTLLAPDGMALVHAIGRSDGPGATNPWLRKYIFPGGYSPALSEVLPAVEASRLFVTDIEILRLHYARTLAAWRARFNANRAAITELYDERFCRMWEFYLIGSEIAFRRQGHMVWQMQMARAVDTVPLTRDYMYERESEALAVVGTAA
ncbi:MAG TPA: cyclopropane-fatty-acyl-phospholipid synthase family protein [Candidatus Sulfotelmatobacter sp.]|nr:cyclopropane-fatty-acyl-phospholipid synthase family protein [Candidatus Sulfotelmatobacter sp.]